MPLVYLKKSSMISTFTGESNFAKILLSTSKVAFHYIFTWIRLTAGAGGESYFQRWKSNRCSFIF